MSQFQLAFQSVHTNEITWVTSMSGDLVQFDEESLAKEVSIHEAGFNKVLATKRQHEPSAQLNTRVVTRPITQ
jgi:hypothetical protein